jgi:hypothetical protein
MTDVRLSTSKTASETGRKGLIANRGRRASWNFMHIHVLRLIAGDRHIIIEK